MGCKNTATTLTFILLEIRATRIAHYWKGPEMGASALDISCIDHFAITVRDLDASVEWYQSLFGFNLLKRWPGVAMVGRGNVKIGLFQLPDSTVPDDLERKVAIIHVAFLVDGHNFNVCMDAVKAKGIAVEGPEDTGIAYSFFFKDRDGHELEITSYHGKVLNGPS